MSNRALAWALSTDLPTVPKFVLVVLSDLADEKDSCYPTRRYIEASTSTGPSSVKRALADLEDRGYLTRERRTRDNGSTTSNRYFLHVGGPVDN